MRARLAPILGTFALGIANLVACAAAATVPVESQALPKATAIPVRFEHTIDTKNAKVGDQVIAKTIQVIALPGGRSIAKGTVLVGHVAALQTFQFDQTPYTHQKPSMLAIHFDKLQVGADAIPVNLAVRAIANTNDSKDATYPHSTDDTDHVGTITLIGGTSFSPLDKMIQSEDGDAIGYNRKNGVFAKLVASASCDGTDTEQSIAIFSPNACGAYGFGGDYLTDSGRDGSGTFTLALRGHAVKLYAGSTALLQVNETK
ncbi:MAG TPA: hypothetical protein VHX20_08585 [Terracidiphilus sp.]|jgi:hypothetical protein|nr:hypothetical protein [Terracidiphilus sp.]